jgi:hypothetical protein
MSPTVINSLNDFGIIYAAVLACASIIAYGYHKIHKMSKIMDNFYRDWSGEPARDGRDAVPGVMARLNRLDGELSRNGGKSVKDVVNRIEKRLVEGDKKFDDLYSRVRDLEEKR